jgi:hypothetical protein
MAVNLEDCYRSLPSSIACGKRRSSNGGVGDSHGVRHGGGGGSVVHWSDLMCTVLLPLCLCPRGLMSGLSIVRQRPSPHFCRSVYFIFLYMSAMIEAETSLLADCIDGQVRIVRLVH